ncbi:MAG: choice-of-anchor L domain-containing protein, partial [Tannerella sp.]|nr:choice-of-anchor L domain-containing protein [Tannerella sp.]
MKEKFLLITLVLSSFVWNGLSAQQRAGYTLAEQAQLDSIKQTYLDMGIPEEWASKRAETIFSKQNKVETRIASGTWNASIPPVAGSIWIDRDSVTGLSYSHAHSFTPEQFVKEIFVKGGKEVADQVIKNVKFIGQGWDPVAEAWTYDGRSLHYFDHGNTDPNVFGMRNGFLLSTMDGRRVEGPNEDDGDFYGGGFPNELTQFWNEIPTYAAWVGAGSLGGLPAENKAKDPDLGPIATASGLPLRTLAVLEFDFCSFTDSVTFEFVFASEEFPDFSNSPYNDAFGFFISGPGLTDAWGNSGDTINIARYPDGAPIAVNSSNWGTSPRYNLGDVPLGDAVNPQYHIPVYIGSDTMEYDGHSILLTAKARLQRGVWYHMKLAIGDVNDQGYGSGVFLMAGSFDLGAPESEVPRPYATTPYDSIYGWNSLYADCLNSIILSVDPSTSDQDICVWSDGSGADFVYDPELNKFFNDSIKYVIPANDSTLTVRFKVGDNVKNGSQVRFYSMFQGGIQKDTTETFDLHAKSNTELKKYYKPTATYAGVLDIRTTNGSPYIQRSLDGGLTWEFARDTITGVMKPFSKSQIANLASEENAYIIFREPNTCCTNDTLFIGKGAGEPVITRTVTMPVISGATVDKIPGEYTVTSMDDFT